MGRVALTLITPPLGKLRQEDCHESEASLNRPQWYTVSSGQPEPQCETLLEENKEDFQRFI